MKRERHEHEQSLDTQDQLRIEIEKTAAKRDRLDHMWHGLQDMLGEFAVDM